MQVKSQSLQRPPVLAQEPFRKLSGDRTAFGKYAWCRKSNKIAVPAESGMIRVWDLQVDEEEQVTGSDGCVYSVSWSRDGNMLASAAEDGGIRFYDSHRLYTGRPVCTWLSGCGSAYHISCSPTSNHQSVSGSQGGWVTLHDLDAKCHTQLHRHASRVWCVEWSPDGHQIASCADDGSVVIWSIVEGKVIWRLPVLDTSDFYGVSGVNAVAWSPDGKQLAVGGDDRRIGIWNTTTRKQERILEGHTGPVTNVGYSADGSLLVSSALSNRSILWQVSSGNRVFLSEDISSSTALHGGALFHPLDPRIVAARTDRERSIAIWEIEEAVLNDGFSQRSTVNYANAKIVVLGNQNAGKTGLARRMAGQEFENTPSTHACQTFEFPAFPDTPDGIEFLEARIWDLAGQYGYRLFHQLHLRDVSVAIVVFDSQSDIDPIWGVDYWNEILNAMADQNPGMKKILVAARSDRGNICLPREEIDHYSKEKGFEAFFSTSARAADGGIDDLVVAIRHAIDWKSIPCVESEKLFQAVRSFVISEKKNAPPIRTISELRQGYRKASGQEINADEFNSLFDTCIRGLEVLGIIRRFTFGERVLLRPEYFDRYAAAMIQAARSFAIGYLPKREAMNGCFRPDDDLCLPDQKSAKLLCRAIVEDFLKQEIAFEENSELHGELLVFPLISPVGFQSSRSDEFEKEVEVSLAIDGMISVHFSTLVVRLSGSLTYRHASTRPNVAKFWPVGGDKTDICGIRIVPYGPGVANLDVFFSGNVNSQTKRQFLAYVLQHFERDAAAVTVRHIYRCECGEPVPSIVAKAFLRHEKPEYVCEKCELHVLLSQHSIDQEPIPTEEMRSQAEANRRYSVWLQSAQSGCDTPECRKWIDACDTGVTIVCFSAVNEKRMPVVSGSETSDENVLHETKCLVDSVRLKEMQHSVSDPGHLFELKANSVLSGFPSVRVMLARDSADAMRVLQDSQFRLKHDDHAIVAGLVYIGSDQYHQIEDAIHDAAQCFLQCEAPGEIRVGDSLYEKLDEASGRYWTRAERRGVSLKPDGPVTWRSLLETDPSETLNVFFSFNSQRIETVAEYKRKIELRYPHVKCFVYYNNLGGDIWSEKNNREIEKCDVFVFFQGREKFDKNSAQFRELNQVDRRKLRPRIVPVLYCGRKKFPAPVREILDQTRIHHINLKTGDSEDDKIDVLIDSVMGRNIEANSSD